MNGVGSLLSLLLGLALLVPTPVFAGEGDLDSTFSSDRKVTTDISGGFDAGRSVAIQSDGKIVVAGETYNGSDYNFAVVCYNSGGTLRL